MGLRQPGTNRVGFRRVGASSGGSSGSPLTASGVAGTNSPFFGKPHLGTTIGNTGKAVDLLQIAGWYAGGLPNFGGTVPFSTPASNATYKENALHAVGHIMPATCHVDAVGYYFESGVGNGEISINVYRNRTDGLNFPGALLCATGIRIATNVSPTAATYQEFTSTSGSFDGSSGRGTIPFSVTAGELIWFAIVGGTRNLTFHNGPSIGGYSMLGINNVPSTVPMGIARVANNTAFAGAAAMDFRDNVFGPFWRSDDTSFANGDNPYVPPDPFPEVNIRNLCAPFVAGDTSSAIDMPAIFFHLTS